MIINRWQHRGRSILRRSYTAMNKDGKFLANLWQAAKFATISGIATYGTLFIINTFSSSTYLNLHISLRGNPYIVYKEPKPEHELFKNKFKAYLSKVIVEILNDKAVVSEATGFVQKVFAEPETQEASTKLLVNTLKEEQFLQRFNQVGLDLILNIIKSPSFQSEIQATLLSTLGSDQIKSKSTNLIKYAAEKPESKEIIATFFKEVFVREDMIASITNILGVSAYQALKMKTTEEKFAEFLMKAVNSPEVKRQIYTLILAPLRQFISFGIY